LGYLPASSYTLPERNTTHNQSRHKVSDQTVANAMLSMVSISIPLIL
jgi:hypothetical protein